MHDNRETDAERCIGVRGIALFDVSLPVGDVCAARACLVNDVALTSPGIFLLLAIRNASASRSLIAFTAWSTFAHAAVMDPGISQYDFTGELTGVALLILIGVMLMALVPAKAGCGPGINSSVAPFGLAHHCSGALYA